MLCFQSSFFLPSSENARAEPRIRAGGVIFAFKENVKIKAEKIIFPSLTVKKEEKIEKLIRQKINKTQSVYGNFTKGLNSVKILFRVISPAVNKLGC